jgi:hypothetical protein
MPDLRDAVTTWALKSDMGMSHSAPDFVRDEGRRFLATDLLCEDCGAVVGERCVGTRFCAQRMQLAAQLARDGEIQSHGPARVVAECPDCERMNGMACAANGHRCAKRTRDGSQCQHAVVPGTRFCRTHTTNQQPAVRKLPPARKPVLSGAQTAEIRHLFASTQHLKLRDPNRWTHAGLAEKFGVSEPVISRAVRGD